MLDWTEVVEEKPTEFVLTPPRAKEDSDTTGLGKIARGAARVRVDDKAMINCRADVNQLLPLKYRWRGRSIYPAATTTGCRRKFPCRLISPCGRVRRL